MDARDIRSAESGPDKGAGPIYRILHGLLRLDETYLSQIVRPNPGGACTSKKLPNFGSVGGGAVLPNRDTPATVERAGPGFPFFAPGIDDFGSLSGGTKMGCPCLLTRWM